MTPQNEHAARVLPMIHTEDHIKHQGHIIIPFLEDPNDWDSEFLGWHCQTCEKGPLKDAEHNGPEG